jgi:hypothetical protein
VAYPILEKAGQLRSPLRGKKGSDKDITLTRRIEDTAKPSTT